MSETGQIGFWDNAEIPRDQSIVNVAQVPQRSPFRYPGGKTWLVPEVREWLRSLNRKPKLFVEPFLGGGIVSLTVAFENLADHVVMVELDDDVASLWQTMLSDDNEWLANRVVEFPVTVESVQEELAKKTIDRKTQAFQTLLRNRISHGGILAPGSGILKHGENGKGIRSRWYADTLRKRIRNIKQFRDRMTFIAGDGIKAVRDRASLKTAVFFIDPPYTAGRNGKRAGTRLYTHNELDHQLLFECCKEIKGDFLMTYDNAEEVLTMAQGKGFQTKTISMKNTHHASMKELLIGRDLSWV